MPSKKAAKPTAPARAPEEAPDGFRVRRDTPVGRHALLEVFPGLDRMETASRQVPDPAERAKLHHETSVEVVDQDMWMYVAPWELPKIPRRVRWKPVTTPNVDCIVIGQGHLRESPTLTLYLDIFHELCHVLQRKAGRELFPEGLNYVQRTTEVDAYRFVIDEAHRYGVAEEVLREYLRVEWIDEAEYRELLVAVGVQPAS